MGVKKILQFQVRRQEMSARVPPPPPLKKVCAPPPQENEQVPYAGNNFPPHI